MSDGFYATGGVLNATVFPAAISFEEEAPKKFIFASRNREMK